MSRLGIEPRQPATQSGTLPKSYRYLARRLAHPTILIRHGKKIFKPKTLRLHMEGFAADLLMPFLIELLHLATQKLRHIGEACHILS
jgi:hypothetical protein